tara:strand:- start:13 stop:906 length:894 start_codon:yes stop_codon:yes gene_type:complete
MSYRDNLYTFLTVYRHGSQQKAAQELNLTQPAISQHIKILEQYIGKPLFYKKGRALLPTPIAHQLAMDVRETFSKLDNTLLQLKKGSQIMSGVVSIGGILEFMSKIIIPAFMQLKNDDIQIRLEAGHATLKERLLGGEVDLAQFTHHVVHPNIVVEKFFHQEFVLVGHPEYRNKISMTKLKQNKLDSLHGVPWVTYDESLLFISEYFQTVFKQSFDAPVKLLVNDLWSILEAVSHGIGVTVLPAYFCQEYIKQKRIVVLYHPENPPSNHFYLGWKHGALSDPKIMYVKQMMIKAGNL